MLALFVKVIQDNSGLLDDRKDQKLRTRESSYEYYEEVEEVEVDGAATNHDDQRQSKFELYYLAVSEFYAILNTNANIMQSFKTTPKLLKFFYLDQLFNSEVEEY